MLMDDPLSALDAEVKQRVFESVFLGMMEGRTRVMATHSVEFLDRVDRVVVMEKGEIVMDGRFEEMKEDPFFEEVLLSMKNDQPQGSSSVRSWGKSHHISSDEKNHFGKNKKSVTIDEAEENVKLSWKLFFHYLFYNR